MADDKKMGQPREADADPAELAAAEALARALDERDQGTAGAVASAMRSAARSIDALDREAIGLLRASAKQVPPLGDLWARGIARGAIEAAGRRAAIAAQRRVRRLVWTGAAAAAALLVVMAGSRLLRPAPGLPEELCSRSAGMLVPGPFATRQGEAERLDLVTEDRLVALREVRYRALTRGGRGVR